MRLLSEQNFFVEYSGLVARPPIALFLLFLTSRPATTEL